MFLLLNRLGQKDEGEWAPGRVQACKGVLWSAALSGAHAAGMLTIIRSDLTICPRRNRDTTPLSTKPAFSLGALPRRVCTRVGWLDRK